MKGIYINAASVGKNFNTSGVNKKITSQVAVLNRYFDMDTEIHNIDELSNGYIDKIIRRLPFTAVSIKWDYRDKYSSYDFIYFRKNDLDYAVCKLFREIKKHNPECKILLEIPTYPYEKEKLANGIFKEMPFYIKDFAAQRRLKRTVDRIVTFSDDDLIFGIKTIKTINGIEFSRIPLRHQSITNNTIHALAVAYFNYWHGYDRFLRGMGEYYRNGGTRNIVFHLVGNGLAISEYHQIVKNYAIEEHVVFHGLLSGEELNTAYDQANLGIGTMALHRINVKKNSTLKSREYAARGLPIVGGKVDFWPNNYKYQLTVPDDESSINIERVIEFFDYIYSNNMANEISEIIRMDAMKLCDMNTTMQPIIDYLRGK